MMLERNGIGRLFGGKSAQHVSGSGMEGRRRREEMRRGRRPTRPGVCGVRSRGRSPGYTCPAGGAQCKGQTGWLGYNGSREEDKG